MKKKIIISLIIISFSFMLWWAKFMLFAPHFLEGPNNTLVSKKITLELASQSPEPIEFNIPNFIPFWKIVGKVDGEMKGTLWGFTDKGEKYFLYLEGTEMPVRYVYKNSTVKIK